MFTFLFHSKMRYMKHQNFYPSIRCISSSIPNCNVPNKAGQMAYDILQTKSKSNKTKQMESKLAHAGIQNKYLSPSLDLSTTYERPADGLYDSYIYSRQNNPTRNLLESFMSELELGTNGKSEDQDQDRDQSLYCTAYSSGMAAVSSILMAHSITYDKIHVILPDDVYHGIPTQLTTVFQNISYSSIDMTTMTNTTRHQTIHTHIQELCQHQHQHQQPSNLSIVLWLETPSNPITKIIDIPKVCQDVKQIQKQHPNLAITTVVDSTLAPPTITRPIQVNTKKKQYSCSFYIFEFKSKSFFPYYYYYYYHHHHPSSFLHHSLISSVSTLYCIQEPNI